MNLNKNSLLATMNPFTLILGLFAAFLIAVISARRYKDTNDFKKACIHAMVIYLICAVVLVLTKTPLLMIVGFGICTFVFTACFSNYYFYK